MQSPTTRFTCPDGYRIYVGARIPRAGRTPRAHQGDAPLLRLGDVRGHLGLGRAQHVIPPSRLTPRPLL